VNPEKDPDVQLMLAVQRGDDAAFEALFRKYVRQVVRFSLSFVGSQARAEELAQEAFVRVYRTRSRYQPAARFSTWLYRIVTNLCVSDARRAEHRFMATVPRAQGDSEAPAVEVGDLRDETSQTGEEHLLAQEDLDRIRGVLGRLPPQQRAALLLARVEGLSYDEVAQSLGSSVSAVKSLIHRATSTMRNELAKDD
jgi:RNA polymerase sigma-70 factor (ECF subfamily)